MVSPLRVITIATADLCETRRFYQDALGMTCVSAPITAAPGKVLARHWGLEHKSTVDTLIFTRPGLAESAAIRAVAIDPDLPPSRPDYDTRYIGALGLGMPMRDIPGQDAMVRALGYTSTVGVTSMAFPREDGTTYDVGEVHYRAPDNLLVLGVDRGHYIPIGPVDADEGIGGPAYSSLITGDRVRLAAFLENVLGFERRRFCDLEAGGPKDGMRLPGGTWVKFEQWFAPAARTGYLVIMELPGIGIPAPNALGLRSRGIAMWTFETNNIDQVLRKVENVDAPVLSRPKDLYLPGLGSVHTFIVATPDGFPIEICQRSINPDN